MGEQEPNPEKHLTNTCAKCEEDFPLTEENSKVTLFLDLPQCTFLYSVCSHCNTPEVLFIAPDGNTTEQCAENGIPVDIEEITPDEIRELYEELTGNVPKPPVKLETLELTPRQENLANFVAYLLLHERLSADDFRGEGPLYI